MVMIYFSIALSIIVIFLLASRIKKRPPGPWGLPIIGNLLQYDSTNVHICLSNLSKKYGPLMYMKLASLPIIVISSARLAKEALKDNDVAFSGRPISSSLSRLSYDYLDISLSPYNDYWREMKKLIVIRLFSHQQVTSFRHAREDEVSRMIKEVSEQAKSTDQLVNLSKAAMSFSSCFISRVTLGKSFDETGFRKTRFEKLLQEIQAMKLVPFVGDYYPLLGWIDRLSGKISQLDKVIKDMDVFLQQLVDEHLSPNRPDYMDGDFLDILFQLREEPSSSVHIDFDNIKALLINIYVAGTDPTAATITWVMTALIKNPSALEKAQEEIRGLVGKKGRVDEDDIDKLPYLKAVVKETLRFYPPAPLLPKATTTRCTLNGYEIEPKTLVFVNLWDIGRDPEYWENPNEFLPERFLNSNIDFKGQDFGLIPFGSGRRRCPGFTLGIAQVELAIANLLYSFDWKLPHGVTEDDIDIETEPGAVVHKKNALCLMAKCYV
ncbi:hypothetical protein RD792_009645 [Penstemon davidsonii]|uniref:Cytochrome P450 n=2 Tax=Penstemon davidsonii TaxID=160366 RepID=A0ABR0CZM0_9LAMI|nr:hypothetical protein RD792_009644 [Penstemon davidsonii]KAK4482487.1 hypothetical protein RD792_009645 [Penstemon davidsonii]